jgi:prolipoprotein diacylglyceryltransferase
MLPTLIRIWKLPIHTFGMTAALGFLLGLSFALREARLQKLDPNKMQSVAIWIFVGILGGGRLLFVLLSLDVYLQDPVRIFYIWEGGLVLYGGLICATALGMWSMRRERLPFWKTCDIYFVGGMLGLSLARVGCLCAGDDWGRIAPGISIIFPAGEYVAGREYAWEPMHPGRMREDLSTVTSKPGLLYDRASEIRPKGPEPAIDRRGYSKDPLKMVVRIVGGDGEAGFEYSTDGGESFSERQTIPKGRATKIHYSTDGRDTWGEVPPPKETKNVQYSTDGGRTPYSTDGGESFSPRAPPATHPGFFTVPGTKLLWAIRFPYPKNPENLLKDDFVGEWLHPAQLYLSFHVFCLFWLLLLRMKTGKRFDGELLAIGMIIYPIVRFIIEFYRGDLLRGAWGPLSTSQWIGIPWLMLGITMYVLLNKKAARRKKALAKGA